MKSLLSLLVLVTVFVVGCDDSFSGNEDEMNTSISSDTVGDWSGTQQLGISSDERGQGVTVDSSDNIYVTGYTSGGLDGNTSSGSNDLFLVKYNSSGVKQ